MERKEIERLSLATGIPIKELNRLNKNDWYHGTTTRDAENLITMGPQAMFNIGDSLDFGAGFYLTDTFARAKSYILRVPILNIDPDIKVEKCVIQYHFEPLKWLFNEWDEIKIPYAYFPKHDDRFAKFVFSNRTENLNNEHPHGKHLIWGVMSDNFPDKIVIDYLNKEISFDEAITRLQKPNSMRQLYIGTQELCNQLKYVDMTIVREEEN